MFGFDENGLYDWQEAMIEDIILEEYFEEERKIKNSITVDEDDDDDDDDDDDFDDDDFDDDDFDDDF